MTALLFRPKPQPDELLSSWIVRLANANVQKLHPFTRRIFQGQAKHWYRDINQYFSRDDLRSLSAFTLTAENAIEQMTLGGFAGTVFEVLQPNGMTPWLLPISMKGRKATAHGQQFCRHCLMDQPVYFRRRWRLALIVACTRHRTLLEDACSWCGAPVSFHASGYAIDLPGDDEALVYCACCRRDLRHGPTGFFGAPSQMTLRLQRTIEDALDAGHSSALPGAQTYTFLGLHGLHHLVRLLCTRRLARRIRSVLLEEAGQLDLDPRSLSANDRFETRRVSDRHQMLEMASQIVNAWPSEFLRVFRKGRVTASNVCDNDGGLPYWLAVVVRWNLTDGHYSPNDNERGSARRFLLSAGHSASNNAVNRILGVSYVSRTTSGRRRPVNAWNVRYRDPGVDRVD